jgi:large subunit ribosomal protein L16
MLQMPRRVKYRKVQRGSFRGIATRGNRVAFGDYGLMSLEHGWVSAKQLEAGRITAARFLGTTGRFYIRIFPHKPITAKPLETRMGTGKGEPEYYAAVVKPGTVIYEIGGVTEALAKECFNLIAHKMPVRVKMIQRI